MRTETKKIKKILSLDSIYLDKGLKVTLKKSKKGVGIYAIKPIKKNETIAYYKVKVYNYDKYKPFDKSTYLITVYTKQGNASKTLIGDIFPESIQPPYRNIPFWGLFSNEPSVKPKKQDSNAYLDTNIRQNYKNRKILRVGDTFVYKIKASKDIKPGEEITWCYGDAYGRSYEANC